MQGSLFGDGEAQPLAPMPQSSLGAVGDELSIAARNSPNEPRQEPVDDADDDAVVPTKVEVRRSKRRRRSVTAYRDGDTTVILMPAHIPRADEQQWVDDMLARLAKQDARRKPSDDALMKRARQLAREYLPQKVAPTSVRWVSNQRRRWGSCTPADGTIRLSDRLQGMPAYVIDYVLLHELAHLIEFDHGPRFQALIEVYPHDARARGYLDGWIDGSGQRDVSSDPSSDCSVDDGPSDELSDEPSA